MESCKHCLWDIREVANGLWRLAGWNTDDDGIDPDLCDGAPDGQHEPMEELVIVNGQLAISRRP